MQIKMCLNQNHINKLLGALTFSSLLFVSSCQIGGPRENLIYGSFGGTKNITEVRRIVIFPFPGNNQESTLFQQYASERLWENRVVPQKNVIREMNRLNLNPQKAFISVENAFLITKALRGDAFLVGYKDPGKILHIKIVNISTKDEWTKTRELLASSSIRMLVEELRADFKNAESIKFEKPSERKLLPLNLHLAILPPNNESTNLLASDIVRKILETRFAEAKYKIAASADVDAVLKSTFSIIDGGQLSAVLPGKLADALGVEGLVYVVVHDFDYQNIIAYQKRKVSATVTIKDKSGEVVWSKEIKAATASIGINRKEIMQNVLLALAKQVYETAIGEQLFDETYAATESMLKRPWWEQYGELWDI